MPVSGLAYVGLAVSDVGAWADFGTGILGMQDGGESSDHVRSLRLDERPWRIRVHPSPANDVIYVGLEADDAASVARLAATLEGQRRVHPSNDRGRGQPARCGPGGDVTKDDPMAWTSKWSTGRAPPTRRSVRPPARNSSRGSMGLGHVVVSTGDIDRSLGFYKVLGFSVSDFIEAEIGPEMKVKLIFLHCNAAPPYAGAASRADPKTPQPPDAGGDLGGHGSGRLLQSSTSRRTDRSAHGPTPYQRSHAVLLCADTRGI